jgi:hypothetical protein
MKKSSNRLMKTAAALATAAAAIAPSFAGAQSIGGLMGLLDMAKQLINQVIPFVITLALLVFLWGILQYILSTDADKRGEARGYMIYGIIGLFVMVSVWGLVNIIVRSLSLDNTAPLAPGLVNPGGTFVNSQ